MDGRSWGDVPRIHTTISSGKSIFSIYFTRQGFSIETLPKREWFNSAFFTRMILPNIVGSVSVLRPKMRVQGYWLHIDNVKPHNAALSHQKTEEARFTRLPSRPIPLIWHSVASSYSGTWRKNEKGGISDLKIRWFRRWEQFWKLSWFECFPKYLNTGSRDCTSALQVRESMSK
jgi:hypothetical protein